MSLDHEVRVVRLGEIIKHDNADSLGITEVDGRPCVVRLSEWSPGDLAVYAPIDSKCPLDDPRFSFLKQPRIRALRLRGVFSMGLLIKPDADMVEGEDVMERLGITVYEAPVEASSGDQDRDPGFLPVYDIESVRRYGYVIEDGEEVILTEKIHGENGRFAWHQDRMWCASRTVFKKPGTSTWWAVAEKMGLADRLRNVCPGIAIYGEVHGNTGGFPYGERGNRLVAFDALDIESRRWLDYDDFVVLTDALELPRVPVLYRGPYSRDLYAMADGPTVLGGGKHIREGWVLRLPVERHHHRLGRVILKLHGQDFLVR